MPSDCISISHGTILIHDFETLKLLLWLWWEECVVEEFDFLSTIDNTYSLKKTLCEKEVTQEMSGIGI